MVKPWGSECSRSNIKIDSCFACCESKVSLFTAQVVSVASCSRGTASSSLLPSERKGCSLTRNRALRRPMWFCSASCLLRHLLDWSLMSHWLSCLETKTCIIVCLHALPTETLMLLGQRCCSLLCQTKNQASQDHYADEASNHARHHYCRRLAVLGTPHCLRARIAVELVCANSDIGWRAGELQLNGHAAGGRLVHAQEAIRPVLRWPAGIKCKYLRGQPWLRQRSHNFQSRQCNQAMPAQPRLQLYACLRITGTGPAHMLAACLRDTQQVPALSLLWIGDCQSVRTASFASTPPWKAW